MGRIGGEDRRRYEVAVREGSILICEPFRLEALYSARDTAEYERLLEILDALPQAPSGPATLRLALSGQLALAQEPSVSHRVKPTDLLVGAIAHEQGMGVLHYDHDYDTIATHGGLRLRSVWIAARGSVA